MRSLIRKAINKVVGIVVDAIQDLDSKCDPRLYLLRAYEAEMEHERIFDKWDGKISVHKSSHLERVRDLNLKYAKLMEEQE